ncbi:MAG TPA: hypothetical protein VGL00_15490 [Terracidiphilus sp.]
MSKSQLNRRGFLKVLGSAAAAGVSPGAFGDGGASVAMVADPRDAVVAAPPAQWAIEQVAEALKGRGISAQRVSGQGDGDGSLRIVAAGAQNRQMSQLLRGAQVEVPDVAEALALVAARGEGKPSLLACGHDTRGLVYALTELADVVRNARDPLAELAAMKTTSERPANEVRSMMRLFTSDVEDKPWYNDRAMWPAYFDMLVTERFNRFNLAFGIGYDFIRNVTDAYFLFTYPFLFDVPGYKVRVPQLPSEERDRNLEMLKYISEQCVARGLEFWVGLWMHGYEWIDSPHPNYTIEGLDKNNHGPYCRDAVRMLLQQVPNISGITFRIHGESGVAEGSFDFWKMVFDGVATCGRRVGIEMHAKGMSRAMIDLALATRLPVAISPKFWGEHLGMPYHQADIRKAEKPKAENATGLLALSSGTRSFLRYGYGDLLREDREWKVVHRIWPGTQRLLLWGDPEFAAGYSRAFGFCGSNGVEIMEPLSFKGRRGSGHAGSRCGYADRSLDPRWDWQKFGYTSRVWGRLLYNPDTRPEVLRRPLLRDFGRCADAIETALGNVSRILPVVTTAYAPSAANNIYWPEMASNESMIDAKQNEVYFDSETPRVFGNASPFDPELFSTANQCAEELLTGKASGRYTPLDVAQWIMGFVEKGRASLAEADRLGSGRDGAAYRRARADIQIQAGVGEFFAAKFRSAVLWHIYEARREQGALLAAIEQYKKARAAFATAADAAKGVYVDDVTFGEQPYLRGHWGDRLPAIDQDIAALSEMVEGGASKESSPEVAAAIKSALETPPRAAVGVQHQAPSQFKRGALLRLAATASQDVTEMRLHYRRLDQAENYVSVAMDRQPSGFAAGIPGEYTQTEFPLEYYFDVGTSDGRVGLYPGFSAGLTSQPYFVVRGI